MMSHDDVKKALQNFSSLNRSVCMNLIGTSSTARFLSPCIDNPPKSCLDDAACVTPSFCSLTLVGKRITSSVLKSAAGPQAAGLKELILSDKRDHVKGRSR